MTITTDSLHRAWRAAMDAGSWTNLERRILDKSDPILPKRFVKDKELFVMTIAATNTLATGQMKPQVQTSFPFPSSRAAIDGIIYHVHGIRHDMRHRKIIREHFQKMENCILESDLSILYPTRGIDHPRHDEIKYLSMLDAAWMFFSPMMVMPQLADHLLFFRRQRTADDVRQYRMVGHVMAGGKQEPVDVSQTVLPEHLAHSWTEYHLDDRFHRSCLLRSLASTEYLAAAAKRMGVPDMHALVGLGHERQIIYFLENPDTVALLADIYRPSFAARQMRRLRSPSIFLACAGYQYAKLLAWQGAGMIEAMSQGDYDPSMAAPPLVTAAMSMLMLGALYRKHKHRFTNKTYLRSLLPYAR